VCRTVTVAREVATAAEARARLAAGEVSVAGSVVPLGRTPDPVAGAPVERCADGRTVRLPFSVAPVMVVANVPRVPTLTVTPAMLARIFTRVITTWNDPEIALANPGVELPDLPLLPLQLPWDTAATAAVSGLLEAQAGEVGPAGAEGVRSGRGARAVRSSAEAARLVSATAGALGYVDAPDALANRLTAARLDTGSGAVAPTATSVARTVDAAGVEGDQRDLRLSGDYAIDDEGAYAMVVVGYESTCAAGLPAREADFVKSFLLYAAGEEGQESLERRGYVQLPAGLRQDVREAVTSLGGS
jgi:phosphate transport system substrate-binding protein